MSNKQRNRRIVFAVLSGIAVAGMIVGSLIGPFSWIFLKRENSATPITPTTTKPALTIKPLPVRPVISAFVTTPEQCPAPVLNPAPDQPLRICDINKTAVYEMGPEGMRLQLTNVDSFHNPLSNGEVVQMSMTPESSQQFSQFTAGQVGKQVAFVRAGTVVWGPKITTPIDGQVLQLTGEVTPQQAADIARMLRNDT